MQAMAANQSFTSSSPTFILPPGGTNGYFSSDESPISTCVRCDASEPSTVDASALPTPGSLAGRKRSRADIFDPEEEDELFREREASAWDGQGSVRLDSGVASEDSARAEAAQRHAPFQPCHIERPSLGSRKSQRMVAPDSTSDDLAQLLLPPQMREATEEPLIDEATRMLGISWTRMSSTEALRINQAAYSKWIQNHYPGLTDVSIWFENTAIPGYLVAARNVYSRQQEFYIFSNDLTEARLVTNDPTQLLSRLQMMPALHLVAPGGCIKAETEPVPVAQADFKVSEIEAVMVGRNVPQHLSNEPESSEPASTISPSKVHHNRNISVDDYYGFMNPGLMARLCSAHEMELD